MDTEETIKKPSLDLNVFPILTSNRVIAINMENSMINRKTSLNDTCVRKPDSSTIGRKAIDEENTDESEISDLKMFRKSNNEIQKTDIKQHESTSVKPKLLNSSPPRKNRSFKIKMTKDNTSLSKEKNRQNDQASNKWSKFAVNAEKIVRKNFFKNNALKK